MKALLYKTEKHVPTASGYTALENMETAGIITTYQLVTLHHKTKPDCFGQSGFELIYVASFSSDYERIGFLHSDSRSARRQFLP